MAFPEHMRPTLALLYHFEGPLRKWPSNLLNVLLPIQHQANQATKELLDCLIWCRIDNASFQILRAKLGEGAREGIAEARTEHYTELRA